MFTWIKFPQENALIPKKKVHKTLLTQETVSLALIGTLKKDLSVKY